MVRVDRNCRAVFTMVPRTAVAAACVLVLAGCSVKVGGDVVDIFGGARPASPDAEDAGNARPLPSPDLPPPPSIPLPSSPRAVEREARPDRVPVVVPPAPPVPATIAGFIAADRAELRPCPEEGARCGPTATLRLNDEVRILRFDGEDWAFVHVPGLDQDGYVLRSHLAPTRQTRPDGRSTTASPPDDPRGRLGREPAPAGSRRPQGGPTEELVK